MIRNCELKNYEINFSEIDQLWVEDYRNATLKLSEDMKDHKAAVIENVAVNSGKLRKYLEERIYPFNGAGYYIVENGKLVQKNKDSWIKFSQKIQAKSKLLYDKVVVNNTGLYCADVYCEDFAIDTVGKRLNLALVMPFEYDQKANQDAKNGEIILGFMKAVITSDVEEQWEVLRYFVSCALKGQKSEIILFLQGQWQRKIILVTRFASM